MTRRTSSLKGEVRRQGLGVTSSKQQQGFMCHMSLVVARDQNELVLGVGHVETFTRTGTKWQGYKGTRRLRRNDPERESLRWLRGVQQFEHSVSSQLDAVHVMDSEADFYQLISDWMRRAVSS
jgi:hypothetical protein